ncbi:MAG: UDP-4-amino-4-deoxy-L-arabinose aminotransferase [Deltaproteobacteria bacterium CG_4_10_14_3_um_filter_60_8]|nr:MAG: UDP-4-amino-4-deoxy-L-arabinose--oxoglutarate aminotransferase [Desulfobacterales bacterium CG2_30_60_27]PIY21311.1 MAG: UDP-4-amino-4-deoxy-L-arabinose aminotransferase [Deltaproteobacteria bacterium CG_4_10_14_3_um_filter_60_8]
MRKDFLPFSKPSISEAEIGAVAEVLRSGWITTGPKCAEFEEAFARYCGAPGAVALTSATGGMHLLFTALGIGPGDEVVTPAMTWVSTVNLITLAGATPVFCDIDRDTLMTTAALIAPCLSERTRLILPVHFAGAAADMAPIRALAASRGITLAEDAAHAAGTEYGGDRIGKKGTSIFSFHPIKNMTTGEGGMFCSDDAALLDKVRCLKFHGLGVDAYDRTMQGRSPQAEVIMPGFKYNLTDFAAVLGLGQLARLNEFIEQRTRLAAHYAARLAEVAEILPLTEPAWPMRHAWHLYIVRLDTAKAGMSRDEFMAELKKRNIGTGLHFRAVHQQKYYRDTLGLPAEALPATTWNSERICSLPLFPAMKLGDVDDVVATIKEVLGR